MEKKFSIIFSYSFVYYFYVARSLASKLFIQLLLSQTFFNWALVLIYCHAHKMKRNFNFRKFIFQTKRCISFVCLVLFCFVFLLVLLFFQKNKSFWLTPTSIERDSVFLACRREYWFLGIRIAKFTNRKSCVAICVLLYFGLIDNLQHTSVMWMARNGCNIHLLRLK